MKRVRLWLLLGAFAFILAGCAGAQEGGEEGETGESGDTAEEAGAEGAGGIQVSATMPIIADFAEQVGGDRAEVTSILPAGGEPHTFQSSPQDAQTISESEVVFSNGLGIDSWIDGLIESAGEGEVQEVVLSDGLEPLEGDDHDHADEGHSDEGHAHEGEEGHADEGHADEGHADEGHADEEHDHGGEGDPHFWLDAEYAQTYVETIRDTLSETDPEGAETYEANAEAYLAELEELDAYIAEQAETIPEEQRKLVTFHEAFGYWSEAYGFEEVGYVLPNPEAEPSSREVAELAEQIQEESVGAVFTEPQFSGSAADTVADEAGVETYEVYTDTLTEEEESNSYVNMMRTNIDRMVEGLS